MAGNNADIKDGNTAVETLDNLLDKASLRILRQTVYILCRIEEYLFSMVFVFYFLISCFTQISDVIICSPMKPTTGIYQTV